MAGPSLLIRIYDRVMTGNFARRYYGSSGFFNFGYWTAETKSQREASETLVDQLVARFGKNCRPVLDVACGVGASSKRLARTFPPNAITGINISAAQIAYARVLCPGCTFAVMDATKLEFPDEHFGAVLCVEAAFHFDTRDQFLREAHRVLKPGGTLVISDILFRFNSKAGRMIANIPAPNRVRDAAEYRQRLSAAGFDDVTIEDATEQCLLRFCRHLAAWPWQEYRTRRMKLGRALVMAAVCAAIAGYFRFSCKTYLLITARKAEKPPPPE